MGFALGTISAVPEEVLVCPKLINELGGTAKRLVTGKRPDWVSFNGGVKKLLDHLRSHLGLPQMPEAADHLNRYFKQTRRRKGKTLNEFITRKTEAYNRARQALDRVTKAYGNPRGPTSWPRTSGSSQAGDRGSDPWQSAQGGPWRAAGGNSSGPEPAGDEPASDAEDEFHDAAAEDDDSWSHGRWN